MISREEIQSFVDQVVRQFRPRQVILFGSYAYGDPSNDSDVDLMVIMNHRGPSAEMASRIRIACPRTFSMDLLVRSPAEIRRRLRMGDPFVREITAEGIVLHQEGADAETIKLSTSRRFLTILRKSFRQLDAGRTISLAEIKQCVG